MFCQQRCADVQLGSSLFARSTCQVPPVARQPRQNTPNWGGRKMLSCSLCTGVGRCSARARLQTGVAAVQTFSALLMVFKSDQLLFPDAQEVLVC